MSPYLKVTSSALKAGTRLLTSTELHAEFKWKI